MAKFTPAERAGLQRLLDALPEDERESRYDEVERVWRHICEQRRGSRKSDAGLPSTWWPSAGDGVPGGPPARYQPQAWK
jgi:hypothetical protein